MAAWMFLSAETRNVFRAALQVDHTTWVRGRGWALSVGLIALPYYQTTDPDLAGVARRAIHEALVDYRANGIMGLSANVVNGFTTSFFLITTHFVVQSCGRTLQI